MLTFAEARAVAVAYAKAHSATWFDDKPVIEREAYWYFPVGSIGSSGLAVDKETGRVEPFGSGLSLEDDRRALLVPARRRSEAHAESERAAFMVA